MFRSLSPLLLAPLLACAGDDDPVLTISGSLSREDTGAWSGAERRELVDHHGTCRVVEVLEAVDADAGGCDGCTLVLHVTKATEHPEAAGCGEDLTDAPGAPSNYAFAPTGGDEGEVWVADDLEGPWLNWSYGVLGDDVLTWDHTAMPDPDPGLTLDDLRPLHGQAPQPR